LKIQRKSPVLKEIKTYLSKDKKSTCKTKKGNIHEANLDQILISKISHHAITKIAESDFFLPMLDLNFQKFENRSSLSTCKFSFETI